MWKLMNLPYNLYFILQEKYKLVYEKQINPFENNISVKPSYNANKIVDINSIPNLNEDEHQFKIKGSLNSENKGSVVTNTEKNKIKYIEPTVDIVISQKSVTDIKDKKRSQLFNIMETCITEINKKEIYISLFKSIYKLMNNILSNPLDEKYCNLNADSNFFKKNINPYDSILKLIQFVYK